MKTLLHLDCSPRGDASISRQLSAEFVKLWREANPGGSVATRDLSTGQLPAVNAAWIGAAYTPPESRTPAMREALAISDALIAELEAADEYVFGVPMHNFGIPAALKLWLDQVVRAGRTFAYKDGLPAGLLSGKRAWFLIASGGVYSPGSPIASYDFVEPYLRTVFGFLGVTDVDFLTAGGAAALNYGKLDRETFLRPHIDTISGWFHPAFANQAAA